MHPDSPGLRPSPSSLPQIPRLTCPSRRRKGGAWREAAGARGLGGDRVPPLLITPPPQTSSASGVSPTNTHTPLAQKSVQLRPPARYISPLHLQRGRRSASTKRRWPRREGYIASGPPGGGGNRGTTGAWGRVEIALPPNRFGPEDEGPTGWLLRANVIWDQLGGTSFATAKNRSRMDVRGSQSARERGGPSADGPRSLAVAERKGAWRKTVRGC